MLYTEEMHTDDMFLTFIKIIVGFISISTTTAVLCNESDARDVASDLVTELRDEIMNRNSTNDMPAPAGCAEESTVDSKWDNDVGINDIIIIRA